MRMGASIAQGFRYPIAALLVHRHHPTARDPMVKGANKDVDGVPGLILKILNQQTNERISCRMEVKMWQAELGIPCHQEGIPLGHFKYPVEDGLFETIAQGTPIGDFVDETRIGICFRRIVQLPVIGVLFRYKNGALTLKGVTPDPATDQIVMIGGIEVIGNCMLLSGMQSQGRWVQCLLTKLPIAGLDYRAFPFGALPTVAFQGFCNGSKLALFIAQCATSAGHLPLLLSVAYACPGSDRGDRSIRLSSHTMNQPCLPIRVFLKKLFGHS